MYFGGILATLEISVTLMPRWARSETRYSPRVLNLTGLVLNIVILWRVIIVVPSHVDIPRFRAAARTHQAFFFHDIQDPGRTRVTDSEPTLQKRSRGLARGFDLCDRFLQHIVVDIFICCPGSAERCAWPLPL